MNDFINIGITNLDGGITPITIRKSSVIFVQVTDKTVGLALEGLATPITFTLGTKDAANSLYDQIVNALK